MSETVFTKVDYDLGSLVKYIALGEIGLPDIQRPFVWKNAKVRDLFDSMYKGYPVGYLLLWQNALVEWGDNTGIADQSPIDYLPSMKTRFSQAQLERMYRLHALPPNWEHLDYREFLEKRRELMSQVIADGYATLITGEGEEDLVTAEFDLSKIVMNGESEAVEFKSTLRTNLHTGNKDPRMELAALKTLAGFLNTDGGTLIVGVSDDGSAVGIVADEFANEDKMGLHLVNIVKTRLGIQAMTNLHARFDDHDDSRVMVVKCLKAPAPVFLKDGDMERFYIRTGPSTTELSPSQTQEYIKQRFKG